MKYFILSAIIFLQTFKLFADNGDTIIVQTFTPGWPVNSGWLAPMEGWFQFPPDSVRFEKILMYYKLKCNPAQNPACGEWDYLTYTRLYEHTGVFDSTLYTHANFLVNGQEFDSIQLINTPSYIYNQAYFYQIAHIDTNSLTSAYLGNNTTNSTTIFPAGNADARTQILWKKTELLNAGLVAGNLTGLKLNFTQSSTVTKLCIKIKSYSIDTLNAAIPITDGFTTVYYNNLTISGAGWKAIEFTTPFSWDGNSNLIIDISYANHQPCLLNAEPIQNALTITSAMPDTYAEFEGNDFISVPEGVFNDIDSAITIAFWVYGDESTQPSNDVVFEGIDSAGNRVVNAHLPWGNGKIYWDAGNIGTSYDRLEKQSTNTNQYKGKWNFWAFTKNVQNGQMKMFLNGNQWTITAGKNKLMNGIKQFTIGSGATKNWGFYHGNIDEFTIWNKALDAASIKKIMYNGVSSTDPNYNNLKAYFKFNETGNVAINEIGNLHGSLHGYPLRESYGGNRIKDFVKANNRPEMIIEQGSFVSQTDSICQIDTVMQSPVMVVFYNDTLHPANATDTAYYWLPYFTYQMDSAGNFTDSTLTVSDTILYKRNTNYYGSPWEITRTFELGRYITPYGIGLDLGSGWTWVYDVSDFRPLLKDSVHLSAGNFQELLDLKFVMIKGTPPRDVVKIENVWQGDFALNDYVNKVPMVTLQLDDETAGAKLRTTVTGHQFDNATNCAEFCPKTHSLDVNGQTRFSWQILQDCSLNPLYPQGGTWIYDRAGWCPGMPGTTQEMELTPFITSDTLRIDYNSEFDDYGNYVMESQLVQYGAPNFTNDAAITEILAPSNYELNNRFNPICGKPVIKIKNTGANMLTSLNIAYKFEGDTFYNYHWTGALAFMQSQIVTLPQMQWNSGFASIGKFVVQVSQPNGQADEYSYNNTLSSNYATAPIYTKPLIVQLKTNSFASENYYEIYDMNGVLVYSKNNLTNNTTYYDTLNFAEGCYEFVLYDTDEDGLSWWANNDGSGFLNFRKLNGTIATSFEADFGAEIRTQFTLIEPTSVNQIKNTKIEMQLFPNPADNEINFYFSNFPEGSALIEIFDISGRKIHSGKISTNSYSYNLTDVDNGLYFAKLCTENGFIIQKFIVKK